MYSGDIKIRSIFVVAAAGIGKRMQLTYPKQFLEYDGKPLFMNPVIIADHNDKIDKIIIITNKENIDKVHELCEKFHINKLYKVVPGGSERQYSVYNAIKEIKKIGNIDKDTIVFVQDGVRPFFKNKYIDDTLYEFENDENIDGVVVSIPIKDTIKIVDDKGYIKETPKRSLLVAANTPQAFKWGKLLMANEMADKENFLGTDDSSLVENIGCTVKVLIGDDDNIKMTTPEDLKYLKK